MPYEKSTLAELIAEGLRPGTNMGTGSDNQNHEPDRSKDVERALMLLLRHIKSANADIEDRLSDLAVVYLWKAGRRRLLVNRGC